MLSGDVQLTINRDEDVLVDAVFDGNVGLRVLQNDSAMAGNCLARDLAGSADIVFAPPYANLGNADQAMRRALGVEKDLNTRSHKVLLMHRIHAQGALHQMLLRGPDTEEVGLRALLVDTGSEYRVRHPKQRGEEAAAGRRRPSGGHHVVHHQNQDESRLSQFEGGMFLCKPVNDDNGCIADEKDCPLAVMFACHLDLGVLFIPASNALVSCAWDTQRSP